MTAAEVEERVPRPNSKLTDDAPQLGPGDVAARVHFGRILVPVDLALDAPAAKTVDMGRPLGAVSVPRGWSALVLLIAQGPLLPGAGPRFIEEPEEALPNRLCASGNNTERMWQDEVHAVH